LAYPQNVLSELAYHAGEHRPRILGSCLHVVLETGRIPDNRIGGQTMQFVEVLLLALLYLLGRVHPLTANPVGLKPGSHWGP